MFGYDEYDEELEREEDKIFTFQERLIRLAAGFVLALWLALLIPILKTIWQVVRGVIYCRRVRPYDASRLPDWIRRKGQKKEGNGNVSK